MGLRDCESSDGFQSTLPHGSDNHRCCMRAQWESISIHAPSRERQPLATLLQMLMLFQSTLPHGSDTKPHFVAFYGYYFNPRSLTGATGTTRLCSSPARNFNPRSLTGATLGAAVPIILANISIHAPSRERRAVQIALANIDAISIHAPSRERRNVLARLGAGTPFQSTLPHGSDDVTPDNYGRYIFQSTLPHGSDIIMHES